MHNEPLMADEWLSWQGWSIASLIGGYQVSVVALLVVPLMSVWEAWSRRRGVA